MQAALPSVFYTSSKSGGNFIEMDFPQYHSTTISYANCCNSRPADNPEDPETGNGTGIPGDLTLGVVEVGGDGDNGVSDLHAEVNLSGLPHLG